MRKNFLFLLLFLQSILFTNAQNLTVTGRVLSAENDKPLSGASVIVVDQNLRTITGNDGSFIFERLPDDSKMIKVESSSRESVTMPIKEKMIVRMEVPSFWKKERMTIILMLIGLIIASLLFWQYRMTKARPLLNSIPGIFTSLGLLGTFIAIYSSLDNPDEFFVSARVVGEVVGNATSSQNSGIIRLIKELIPAFSSSIAGLVFALVSTVAVKLVFAQEDRSERLKVGETTPEDNIYNLALNSKHLLIEVAKLNHQVKLSNEESKNAIVEQMRMQEEASKGYIEKLNSSISQQSSILEKFIDDFVKRMDTVLTNMSDKIERQVNVFGEDQFKKTSVVINEIATKMASMSESLLVSQKESVQEMMANTNSELKDLTKALSETVAEMKDDVTAGLVQMSTKQNEELANLLGKYTSMMEQIKAQNSSMVTYLNQIDTDTTTAIKDMQDNQMEQLAGVVAQYNNLSGKLSAQNAELASQMSERHTDIVTQMTANNADLASKLTQQHSDLVSQMTSQQSAFAIQMQTQMNDEYKKIQESNVKSMQQMVSMKDEYQNLAAEILKQSTDMNRQSVDDLKSSMATFVDQMVKSIGEQCALLKESLTVNVTALDAYYKNLKDAIADLKVNYDQSVLAYEDAVTIAHRTNEGAEKMIKEVATSLKSVVDTNAKIDEMLGLLSSRQESVDALKSRINEINAAVTSLQRVETMLNKYLNQ